MRKNDILELTCESLGADFVGVCRAEGQVVFVPGALPKERLRVRIVKVEKKFAFGRLEDVLIPSLERAEPPCPVARRCGGCVAQHLSYPATLEAKRQQAIDCLTRVGGLSAPNVPPTLGMESPWRYRNKAAFPVAGEIGAPRIGCFAARSHEVIDIQAGCLLQSETSNALLSAVRGWMIEYGIEPYDEKAHAGLVRHVMTREAASGAMLVLVCNGEQIPHADALIVRARDAAPGRAGAIRPYEGYDGNDGNDGNEGNNRCHPERAAGEVEGSISAQNAAPSLQSVILSINTKRTNVILGEKFKTLWGADAIEESLLGLRFRVSPQSFFQVNPKQTARLYETALEYLAPTQNEHILDVYCGCGSITLPIAQKAGRVTGVEIVPEAVADARENARRNGVGNADFIVGAAETVLPKLGLRPDAVVLDPPRKGCERAVLEAVADASPNRVVYVSCNPATLARDAAILRERGFMLQKTQPVDMFPWTGAIESVSLFRSS